MRRANRDPQDIHGGQVIPDTSTTNEHAPGVSYFFAVRPDSRARVEIATVAERLKKSQRFSGTPVGIDSLHLALCPAGRPRRLQQSLEAALRSAAAEVQGVCFEMTLDTMMRFTARDGQFPFGLCADSGSSSEALRLRKAVAAAQLGVGLQVSGVSSFMPHVTLQHGPMIDAIEEAITPIHWQVREFVLMRSFFGQSMHEVIGCWPLKPPPEPEAIDLLDELANMPELPEFRDYTNEGEPR
ncbi:MAG TPA: 2'-5' RNA ligase family protein [Rhodanobacter sp.]|nr:2'-5' RNA ligase family protein [Rhodanobacter sp.]